MTAVMKAARALKARAFGVIPLSEVEGSAAVEAGRSAGVVGVLSELLRYDEKYAGLVNFLAGDVIVVESEAVGYLHSSDGVKAVTLGGEVFETGGRAFSHGFQDIVLGILQGLEDIEGVSEIEEAALSLKKAIQKRKGELEGIESDSRSLMKERIKKIATVASLKAEADTITRISGRYKSIFKSMAQDYEKEVTTVERLSAKLATATERRESLQKALPELHAIIQSIEALHLADHLQELETSRKSLDEEANYLRSRIAELNLSFTREKANLENVLQRNLEENQLDLHSALDDYNQAKEFARDAPKRIRELA